MMTSTAALVWSSAQISYFKIKTGDANGQEVEMACDGTFHLRFICLMFSHPFSLPSIAKNNVFKEAKCYKMNKHHSEKCMVMVSIMDKIFWTAVEVWPSTTFYSSLQQVPASLMANVVLNSLSLSEQLFPQTRITLVRTCNPSYYCFLGLTYHSLLQIICDVYSAAKASIHTFNILVSDTSLWT